MSCKKSASTSAVRCKAARACDGCVKKPARWYCAADDAFLCQACDHSVHSANSLARRHARVRLKTASPPRDEPAPTWHRGFTRKARTPRKSDKKPSPPGSRDHPFPVVPEICGDETATEDSDEQLLMYRVPIFDPLVAELCAAAVTPTSAGDELKAVAARESFCDGEMSLQGFLPTEMDLEDFAADVESLLGRGLEDECDFGIEGLGFIDCDNNGRVKLEEDDEEAKDDNNSKGCCWGETMMEIDMMRPEPLELNFEELEESPVSCGGDDEEDRKVVEAPASKVNNGEEDHAKKSKKKKKKKKILLNLDYEAVITEWASQGSPWTNGDRPDFDIDPSWPNTTGTMDTQLQQHHHYMDLSGLVVGGQIPAALVDGGREARMSRYREKRRNRLFSKKIRYEVRKLNAEKRPRMKGRFVKQAGSSSPPLK